MRKKIGSLHIESCRGWLVEAKVLCILRHQGAQLMLAYSWARPADFDAGKCRGGTFLFLLFCHFLSFSSFSPIPLFHSTIASLFSLPLGDDIKWPTRIDVSLNPKTINQYWELQNVQGLVVQSIVSLWSSLVVKMLTVLVSTISNSQLFLLKKFVADDIWISFFIFQRKQVLTFHVNRLPKIKKNSNVVCCSCDWHFKG